MHKQEFVNAVFELNEKLQIVPHYETVREIFKTEEKSIKIIDIDSISLEMESMLIAIRHLSTEATDILENLDDNQLFFIEPRNPILKLSQTLQSQIEKSKESADKAKLDEGEVYIPKSSFLMNPLFCSYYDLMAKAAGLHQAAERLSHTPDEQYDPQSLFKVSLFSSRGYSTTSVANFMETLNAAVGYLCEYYGVEYEEPKILSIETGSLEFILSLPGQLNVAYASYGAGVIALAGLLYSSAQGGFKLKMSLEKSRQEKLNTLIKEHGLEEAKAKADTALIQKAAALIQLGINATELQDSLKRRDKLEIEGIAEALNDALPDEGLNSQIQQIVSKALYPPALNPAKKQLSESSDNTD